MDYLDIDCSHDVDTPIAMLHASETSSCLDDAEHPMIIPMDTPTPPTTPLGPMTRARAKAIEDKVNSHLSELPLFMHETWLLPQAEVLCMMRYQEGPPEDAHEDVQVP